MELNLKIAGIPFSVTGPYEIPAIMLARFVTDEKPAFHIHITSEDIQKAYERVLCSPKTEVVKSYLRTSQLNARLEYDAMYSLVAEKMLDYDILLFHASAVAIDEKAYLFTADSGTGKSTHTAFWQDAFGDRAVIINDDRPFLRFEPNGQVVVCGAPWQGRKNIGYNMEVPLQGVCLLKRGLENRIERINAEDALKTLMGQCRHYRSNDKEAKTLELLSRLCSCPLYQLHCTMSSEAARVSYSAMRGDC